MVLFYDACAIVYLVEGVDPWFTRLRAVLKRLNAAQAEHAVSELSLLECCVQPQRLEQTELLSRFGDFFSREHLIRVQLDQQVIAIATGLRARHNLKTPDALQVACALRLPGDTVFLTNDHRLDRVPNLNVRILD